MKDSICINFTLGCCFSTYEDSVTHCMANFLPAPHQKLLMKEFFVELGEAQSQRWRILLAFMLLHSRTFWELSVPSQKNWTSFSETSMLNLTENISQKCRPAFPWPAISSFQACVRSLMNPSAQLLFGCWKLWKGE